MRLRVPLRLCVRHMTEEKNNHTVSDLLTQAAELVAQAKFEHEAQVGRLLSLVDSKAANPVAKPELQAAAEESSVRTLAFMKSFPRGQEASQEARVKVRTSLSLHQAACRELPFTTRRQLSSLATSVQRMGATESSFAPLTTQRTQ